MSLNRCTTTPRRKRRKKGRTPPGEHLGYCCRCQRMDGGCRKGQRRGPQEYSTPRRKRTQVEKWEGLRLRRSLWQESVLHRFNGWLARNHLSGARLTCQFRGASGPDTGVNGNFPDSPLVDFDTSCIAVPPKVSENMRPSNMTDHMSSQLRPSSGQCGNELILLQMRPRRKN